MNYDQLRLKIQNSIKGNASREITGFLLQEVLLSMVDILGADIISMATGSTGKATDSDKLGGYPASHYATATSVTSLENLLASMWTIDEETGDLVTDRNVRIAKNVIIGGDMSSAAKGRDAGAAGGIIGVKVGDAEYTDIIDGLLNMTEAFEGLDVDVDLSDYYTNEETDAKIAESLIPYAKIADVGSTYATKASLETLQGEVNNIEAILGMDEEAEGVINTWNEVKEFLDGYSSSDDLAAILSTMNADIAKRALDSDLDTLAGRVGVNELAIADNAGNIKKNFDAIGTLESNKANWGTTLAHYGITDAYTKVNVDDLLKKYLLLEAESQTIKGNLKIEGNLIIAGDMSSEGTGGNSGADGTVIGVVVNGTSYEDETNGMLDLSSLMNQYALTTAIPTSLPASDVYPWAKKSSLALVDIPDLSSRYLSTAGGTLSGENNILSLDGTTNSYIYFKVASVNKASVGYYRNLAFIANEGSYARIGVADDGTPQYWNDNYGTKKYTIIHEGNIANQSVASAKILTKHGGTSTSASVWNPKRTWTKVWGQSFADSNISSDTGDMVYYVRPSEYASGQTELCCIIDGDFYAGAGGTGPYKVWHDGNFKPADYLPLSGGTITNNSNSFPLKVVSNYSVETAIQFYRGSNLKGVIGYYDNLGTFLWNTTAQSRLWLTDSDGLFFSPNANSAKYSVLHEGNYSTFAISVNGGKITSSNYDGLIIKRASDSAGALIAFENNGGRLGLFGFEGSGKVPIVYLGADTFSHKYLIHSGNSTSYNAGGLAHSNGTIGAVVNSSGNVTIGASDLAGTSAKLDVNGSARISSTLTVGSTITAPGITSSGIVTITSGSDIVNIDATGSSTYNLLYFLKNGTRKAAIGYYEGMAFISNETSPYPRIGVTDSGEAQYWSSNSKSTAKKIWHGGNSNGSSYPWAASKLSLNGPMYIERANFYGSYDEGIRIAGTADQWCVIMLGTESGKTNGYQASQWGLIKTNTDSFRISRGTSTTSLLEILYSGNVGIGITNPKAKLHVNGDIIMAGDLSSTSDMRLKQRIGDVVFDLKTMAEMPLFTFRWKDGRDGRLHLGSSAQYWEKPAPWLVMGDETKTLNYAVLGVAGMKSLAVTAVDHETRIKMLERKVDELETENRRLRYGN